MHPNRLFDLHVFVFVVMAIAPGDAVILRTSVRNELAANRKRLKAAAPDQTESTL